MDKNMNLNGRVVDGNKLGRTIGFPTANIEIDIIPNIAYGVYLVEIIIDDKRFYGVANFGMRSSINPTNSPILEVHILDFNRDLYNSEIQLNFIEFLRKEQKFDSFEKLKMKINEDIELARLLIKKQK